MEEVKVDSKRKEVKAAVQTKPDPTVKAPKNDEGGYKSEYATISANSTAAENSALQRLNQLQRAEKKTWKGVRAECTGRPGTCTLLNKKRYFPVQQF